MTKKIKERLRAGSNRTYLARDFNGFRNQLIEQARIFFPDKIQDFSEASLGGLLVDMAASVGDTMSYYLDHQFKELDPGRAVEYENINTHLINAGVKVTGAAPSSTEVTLTFVIPAEEYFTDDGEIDYRPKETALPYVFAETVLESESGVKFNLTEDLDFAKKDSLGRLKATSKVAAHSSASVPSFYEVSLTSYVISGEERTESFTIPDSHVPFREITLSKSNVTQIVSVYDSENNLYYEVESLSQDTVFDSVDNDNVRDSDLVPMTLELMPAPRRFVRRVSPNSLETTLRFGSGNSLALDDDIAPDPSELALNLYGKKNFPKFSIDPNNLIDTQTLGLSPRNTVIDVTYRHGGGLSHNVDVGTITTVSTLSMEYRNNPEPKDALSVRQSLKTTNHRAASGGAEAPDIEFLRSLISASRNSQSRIVTREDLLARIYTLPAQFGRVFRVGLSENSISGMSSVVHIISLDRDGNLAISPDTLKQNLSTYLNEFRLLSDAIDIVDAKVLNYGVKYEVVLQKTVNKQSTLLTLNRAIAESLNIRYFQIDQPIIIDDIVNVILNTRGVISINYLEIAPVLGSGDATGNMFGKGIGDRTYSTIPFDTIGSVKSGILRGDVGTIFELRYPEHDIIGHAV